MGTEDKTFKCPDCGHEMTTNADPKAMLATHRDQSHSFGGKCTGKKEPEKKAKK